MKKFIFLFLLVLTVSGCSSVEKAEYLNKNKSELKSSYDAEDYNKLINDLKTNNVFLAGEMHGIKENYTLRLNLLKFFKENAEVRYYLAEMGYSSSFYINRYLTTGDEKYLFLVTNSIAGSYDHSVEDVEFWRSLYKYNNSLPEKERVKVIGLDLEHQFWISILHLNEILKNKNLGPEMEKVLEGLNTLSVCICPDMNNTKDILKNIQKINIFSHSKIIKDIYNDLEKRRSIYVKLLDKDELYDLELTLSNSNDTVRIYKNIDDISYFNFEREKSIYNNFIEVYDRLNGGKYFGQWGGFHILQKSRADEDSFASYLNLENSPVKQKVISIKFVYDNQKHKVTNRKILNAFKEYSTSKFTLYKLENFDSIGEVPCPINDYDLSDITEYFQYGILIRDPEKVTAL
ncbi:lipoprotein [uncultured Ilyobacter sp.]|uniref:lipoprotein n=1 Tax=uncultured Ilyobacter sp. TaxID=544433 RepID=UPI0029C771DD|nr:lipoprotein [uncultured Ilyobacter sp.]